MLDSLLRYALRHRPVVCLASLVLVGAGILAAFKLPMDAVPDITNVQVQVNTFVPALAPEEVEQQVTFPLENRLSGVPDMVEFRSLSKTGLSQVTMVFADGTDLYRTRQLVSERLVAAQDDLPPGLTPRMSPIATGLGEIFYYTIDYSDSTKREESREEQLRELRLLHETVVKPLLRQTPGVAEVNMTGGYEKQFVIQPDPARLMQAGITMPELARLIGENTRNAGGGMVEVGSEQLVIRARGRVSTLEEIAALPLKFGGGVRPIVVGDVAQVVVGSGFRTGAGTVDGEEALVCAVIMLAGGNTRLVSRAVAERLRGIQEKLPEDVSLRPLYDRSHLVGRTLRTVRNNLAEGALLVVVVLFLLLGNIRGALIVALVIPLSMLGAILGMVKLGVPGNLMSLGAVDFGLIIDGAVVMVENILRHLGSRQHDLGRRLTKEERLTEVLRSAREVARPMFFGVLVITVVYVPILALEGIEGKMFRPMAVVVMLAIGAALVLALTLMPVLCSLMLGGDIREGDNALVHLCKAAYAPLLRLGLRLRWPMLLGVVVLCAGAFHTFGNLGAELLPELEEGDFTAFMIRPSETGLSTSVRTQCGAEKLLLASFPEITHVFSRIGTDEIASDPMGVNVSDCYIMLRPRHEWREENGRTIGKDRLADLMSAELTRHIPGQSYLFSQPIQMRFNEILEGTRADVAVKVYGDDLGRLAELAGEISEVIEEVPGAGEVEEESEGQVPAIEITQKRNEMLRRNLQAEDLNSAIETALAGAEVGRVIEGNRRYPIIVRMDDAARGDIAELEKLPVGSDGGSLLTLGQVASIARTSQPPVIIRENARRRTAILVSVRGRDLAGFVSEAKQRIREKVEAPGFEIEFGGQFQNYVAARQRLMIVVPIALLLIFALIYLSFGSLRQAALIFLCVPMAMTGGVFALALRDLDFTISAGIGFIALSGIAVLNGIMLISYINQLRREGRSLPDAVSEGTLTRLRPKLMTALVASLGFVPMAFATGAGAEVQRPLATVVIGGILTSTFLSLLVLPVLYEWIEADKPSATRS